MGLTKLDPNLIGQDSTGTGKITSAGGSVSIDSSGNVRIANSSANSIMFAANGTVGIGTSAPATKLHIIGNSGTGITESRVAGGGSSGDYGIVSVATSTTVKGRIIADADTGDFRIDTSGSAGGILFKTGASYTDRLYIAANGSVGIGTATPNAHLEIGGTNPEIRLGPAGTSSGAYMAYNTSGNYFTLNAVTQGVSYRDLCFATDGGKVGIGTTSPANTLHVTGTLLVDNQLSANTIAYKQLKFDGTNGTDVTPTGASEASYRIFNGTNFRNLGMFQFRNGNQYLHLKTNWTSDNLMYQFLAMGYLYNNGNLWSLHGGYTYNGGIINAHTQTPGNHGFSGAYRGSGGYLCLRLSRADNGYTEGYITVFAHTFDASTQNALNIIAYSQNNTSGSYY